MDMLGIFSKNREVNIKKKNFKEWLMVEYADFLYNFTSVPLYDTLGEDAFKFVLDQTKITTVFCSKDSVDALVKMKDHATLKNVVSFDDLSEEVTKNLVERGLKVFFYKDMIDPSKGQEE